MTSLFALSVMIALYLIIMIIVLIGKADIFDNYWMQKLHLTHDQSPKSQKPKIRRLMLDTSALAGDTFLVILTLLVTGIAVAIDNSQLLHSYLIIALSARALGYVLKKIVNRQRPNFLKNAPQMFTTSFPSVHSMMATTLYLWLGFIMPQIMDIESSYLLLSLCIPLILTVGFSRLYLAVHWPSDVFAGWISGLIIILSYTTFYSI